MTEKLHSMFRTDGATMIETVDYVVGELRLHGFRKDMLDQAFRSVHSLKSEAAYLGYHELAGGAEVLESIFAQWRDRKTQLQDADFGKVTSALQAIKRSFTAVAGGSDGKTIATGRTTPAVQPTVDVPKPRATVREPNVSKPAAPRKSASRDAEFAIRVTSLQRQLLREAEGRGERLYRLECEVDPTEPMTYARLYLVINNLEQAVHVVKMHPDIRTIRAGRSSFIQALITTGIPEQQIKRIVDVDQISRVSLSALDFEALVRNRTNRAAADSPLDATSAASRLFSIRMPARLYEELCLNADEIHNKLNREWMELNKAPIESSIRARIQWNLFLVNRLAGWMRNEIQNFSTVSLADAFQGLPDFVEDLSRQLGKKAVLKIQGEQERVYLPVSDVLTDVLLHLIRNAIDHGIELPETRRAHGKPEEGTLRISAHSTSEHLTIRFEDDGVGISEESVRAMERGATRERLIVNAPAAAPGSATASDDEKLRSAIYEERDLLAVISRAGFTTRLEPGTVSGRGVGLDVVSYSVRKLLCGSIELQNNPGHGCVFSLVLPISSNLITVLILQAGDEYLALPRVFVSDTFELDRRFVFRDEHDGTYYRYSGENVRMYTVHEHFPEAMTLERTRLGIIIEIAGERGVIVSDSLVSEETVVHDRSKRNVVFSQILDKDVRLFLPSQLLSALSFRRGDPR
ncbi:MAG TPA: ATP-binding protein [Spirochaetia bacterium]|nr:ATP-binding protein [Spirochaetia bacterium]